MKKTMSLREFIQWFCGELYIKRIGRKFRIIDSYNEDDSSRDYGVHIEFDDVNKIEPQFLIPEVHIDTMIDFLLNDDFPNHYGIKEEDLKKIRNEFLLENADKLCLKYGYEEAYNDLKNICGVLRKEIELVIEDGDYESRDTTLYEWAKGELEINSYNRFSENKDFKCLFSSEQEVFGDDTTNYEFYFIIEKEWLENYIKTNYAINSVDEFYQFYTSEDSDVILEEGIKERVVLEIIKS